jgi:hypothetical protein
VIGIHKNTGHDFLPFLVFLGAAMINLTPIIAALLFSCFSAENSKKSTGELFADPAGFRTTFAKCSACCGLRRRRLRPIGQIPG